jgi:hypothetical protein
MNIALKVGSSVGVGGAIASALLGAGGNPTAEVVGPAMIGLTIACGVAEFVRSRRGAALSSRYRLSPLTPITSQVTGGVPAQIDARPGDLVAVNADIGSRT